MLYLASVAHIIILIAINNVPCFWPLLLMQISTFGEDILACSWLSHHDATSGLNVF